MSRIFISPKHDGFAILTAGEEDEFYGWVPAEEFVAKQYAELAALRSEIANYETARQEDARRLEQITAEREAMREVVKQLEWITDKETGIQSCVICGAFLHRGHHFDDCTLAAVLKGGKG